MKKIIAKSSLAAVVCVGLMATAASADMTLDFNGTFNLEDAGSYFSLTFSPTAEIVQATSSSYYTLEGGEYVTIGEIQIDPNNVNQPNFSITNAPVSFAVYDSGDTLIFSGDLNVTQFFAYSNLSSASVDPDIQITSNLSNIQLNTSLYTGNMGTVFDNIGQGDIFINLFASTPFNINGVLQSPVSGRSDIYATPVPEPGVTLLFGLGVAGFVGMIRRKNTLAD